jgi:hypothetical protein
MSKSPVKTPAVRAATIRPGLLVALKTSVSGNVHYHKQDKGVTIEGDAEVLRWETERTIKDPAEYKAASQVRMKARRAITDTCAKSSFGLLCAESNASKLAEGIAKAHKMADAFNAKAKVTRVIVNVIAGRVAADDVEATKAINGEVRELLEAMQNGVKTMNVEAIRDAAKRAKKISSIVAAGASEQLKVAIDTAREAAKKLVKAGETAARQVDKEALEVLKTSRTAFLDIDVEEPAKPAPTKVKAKGRAVDLA